MIAPRFTASITALAVVASLVLGASPALAADLPAEPTPAATPEAPSPAARNPSASTPAPSEPAVAPAAEKPEAAPAESQPAPAASEAPATVDTPAAEPLPVPEVGAATSTTIELTWPETESLALDELDVLVFRAEAEKPETTIWIAEPEQKLVTELEPTEKLVGLKLTGLAPDTEYELVVRDHDDEATESKRSDAFTTLAISDESSAAEGAGPSLTSPSPTDSLEPQVAAAAADPLAPVVTSRGATVISVDVAAYAAVASVGVDYPYYTISVYAGETVVKTGSIINATTGLVTGLTPNTEYTVEVLENTYLIPSPRSALVTTAAEATAPGVIPGVPSTEVTSSSTIFVSWPAVDSGADVRTYTARAYRDGVLASTKAGLDPFTNGTNWQFTGLLSNTEYTFTVQAIGYDLPGLESAASTPVFTAKGLPGVPDKAVTSRPSMLSTDIDVAWTAPVNNGGYPISGYVLRFYNTGSTATANLVRQVEVPGTQLAYTFEDSWIVGGAITVQVVARNAAGTSAASAHSTALTLAANATPTTAVTANTVIVSAPTDDGFTLKFNAPTGATATTGYMVRVVEHLPSNAANSSNYTYALRDLGIGHATTGTITTAISGLEGGRSYRAAVTAYTQTGDVLTYRASSGRSTTVVKTTGSGVPAQPVTKAATPVVTGIDSISWSGAALPEAHNGGSALTGYAVALFENGSATARETQTVEAAELGPQTAFTGLTKDTYYQVRYAGINANGTGEFSEISDGVRTLAKSAPGSVAPALSTTALLVAAIAAGDVTELTAESLGLAASLESNSEVAFTTPASAPESAFVLAAAAADGAGELWLYPATTAPDYQGEFALSGGKAVVDFTLGDIATGTYYLALFSENAAPIAVKLAVTRPITGPTELNDAVFRWGINNESNNGAFFGGCNFLTAGKAPSAGHSAVFNQTQYAAQGAGVDANVRIEKPNAAGDYQLASWGTKCLTRTGAPVTSSVNSAFTESQVVITGGQGIVDPSKDSATIQWTGSFTVSFYGGLTYWYATDPKLTVVEGVGTLTATASGYGTDMFDQTKWVELESREITLATLPDVKLTSKGFSTQPAYVGVAVDTTGGSHQPQTAKTTTNAAYWGSFPQDFVDFQAETGQLAYWYSSGGSQDAAKPALPLHVGYDASTYEDPDSGDGDGSGESTTPPKTIKPPVTGQKPLNITFASPTETSVDSLASLLALIKDGTVTKVAARKAGIPTSFAIGDRLDFDLAWEGEDTSGVIWLYPGVTYAGTFTVVDGRVQVALDTSAFEKLGDTYFTFFGNEGTVVTVVSEALAAPEAETTAVDVAHDPQASVAAALPTAPANDEMLVWLLGALAILLLAAGGAAVVVLRGKSRTNPAI